MTLIRKPLLTSVRSGFFFSVLSGFLLTTGYPPMGLWWLQLFAPLPFLFALSQSQRTGRATLLGFCCGLSAFGLGYFWMTRFSEWSGNWSYVFWMGLVLYQSLFFAAFALSFRFLQTRLGGDRGLLAAPFLWVLIEYLASQGPLGVPEIVGHGQLNNPLMRAIAPVLGVNGISFFVLGLNAVIALALLNRFRKPQRLVRLGIVWSLAFAFVFGINSVQMTKLSGEGDSFVAALVVPKIGAALLNDSTKGREVWSAYLEETIRLLETKETPPDLIVWSEMLFPYSFNVHGALWRRLNQALGSYRGEILFGGPDKKEGRFYNTAFLASGGRIVDSYQKKKLFPFGEYVPPRGLLGFIRQYLPLKLRREDYFPGENFRPIASSQAKIGVSICFESLYADLIREQVKAGAELLINLTNDGWFDGSSVGDRHFFVGAMRALENGRYYLQVASSGVTGAVNPEGKTIALTRSSSPQSLSLPVIPSRNQTVFTRLGSWRFVILLVINAAFFIAWGTERNPLRQRIDAFRFSN